MHYCHNPLVPLVVETPTWLIKLKTKKTITGIEIDLRLFTFFNNKVLVIEYFIVDLL
jgi:hypothetical protein